MPIHNFRFIDYNGHRPALNIRILNPDKPDKFFDTIGVIDTGADTCAIPASFARILGHNLIKGEKSNPITGNGSTQAYSHKTKIEIRNEEGEVIHDFSRKIDFVVNLHVVLLGVREFLGNHTLNIDYPNTRFSITSDTMKGI